MKMTIRLIFFCLILTNSLIAQTNLDSTQIDTTWWYGNYSKGLEYLDGNDLEAAEKEFRKILEKDDNIAHVYYGLGQVYNKGEKGSDEAIENLEKAIEIDPELVDAYYCLGLIYEDNGSGSSSKDCFETVIELNPHHTDGWISLARVEEKFRMPWEYPVSPESLGILADALKINPRDKKLYEQYKEYLFWYSYEELSIPTFKYLIQQNPSRTEYLLDFAHVLYNMDEYEHAMKLLDSIEVGYSNYSQFEINLLRSKILFNTEEMEKGLVYYWSAINAIKDSADVNEIFSDLCYIMNDSEFVDYQSTSLTDMPEFYSRLWLSRDPNLATKINERIAEHYKRLKVAWKDYRRYISGYYNKVVIYKMDHPFFGTFNVKFGDDLSNPFVSKALPEKRDMDDMGLIYIRHGEPDNFAFYNCMSCPQNISWKYFANPFRPELIFHFSKHSDIRGWYLETLPYSFSNRGDFGGLYAQLDPLNSLSQDISDRLWKYEELNNENIENAKIGLKTETTEYVYKNTLIEFPLEYFCFKDKKSKTEIDLFYGIDGTNFILNTSGQKNHLSYSTFIGIYDTNWTEVVRINYDNEISLNVDQDEWDENSIVEMERFSVPPGDYNFEIQLQDKMSENLGVYKGSVTFPDYWKTELMLSDIILSDTVSRKSEPGHFKKGDIEFSPHMFSAYEERETVGIYFEIYNLVYDFADRTNFEVTWWLKEADDDEEIDAVQSTLPYSGKSRDDTIYINLELSDTDSGEYELVVLVKDMISKVEVSKKVRLTVI